MEALLPAPSQNQRVFSTAAVNTRQALTPREPLSGRVDAWLRCLEVGSGG